MSDTTTYTDRDTNYGDPYRRAGEIFARGVERFLYRQYEADGTDSPFYCNHDYLAWEIKRFDGAKTGSGQHFNDLDYTLPDNPEPPAPLGENPQDEPSLVTDQTPDPWPVGDEA